MFSVVPLFFITPLVIAAKSIEGTVIPLWLIMLTTVIGIIVHIVRNVHNYPSMIIDSKKVMKQIENRYLEN
jgi:hypothetical protein